VESPADIATNDPGGGHDRPEWWKTGVVYQVYPRSFADSDGDGVGDLPGMTARLDHLVDLGVDAVWSSPFYRSPMADFGYDVADHCDVDPLFGTLADADELIAAAHRRGLRVIVDYVPNHVSSEHPWFRAARSSRDDPHRNWFVWRDPAPDGGPPNNWSAAFGAERAWTLDATTGQYYLHLFLPEQPDLNWNEPAVVDAMHDVLRFWMARGVDGFRADVVHCIGKDDELADLPGDLAGLPAMLQDFGPGTHEQLRAIRRLLDAEPGDRVVVGETYVLSARQMASYLGDGDELHLAFNFEALHCPWDAARWRAQVELAAELLDPVGAWPTWVLSNHDVPRHRTRFGTEARARAAAVLLLTLRGTPFLYMGEELGLADAVVPPDAAVDPGGRDGCRAPIPWTAGDGHGWPAQPWLPWTPDAARLSVAAQRGDPGSMLEHYRRLLRLRRSTPALHRGDLELLDAPEGVLRYRRRHGAQAVEVAVNFTDEVVGDAVSPGRWLGGTARPDGDAPHGPLAPDEARVVAPDPGAGPRQVRA
jgi:alpha-glucosidase